MVATPSCGVESIVHIVRGVVEGEGRDDDWLSVVDRTLGEDLEMINASLEHFQWYFVHFSLCQ